MPCLDSSEINFIEICRAEDSVLQVDIALRNLRVLCQAAGRRDCVPYGVVAIYGILVKLPKVHQPFVYAVFSCLVLAITPPL